MEELYNKYTELKAMKDSETDQINRDQEIKFIKFAQAADEYIERLKSENEALKATISELRNEVSSLRSSRDRQYDCHEDLLSEERQKSQRLYDEIKRLQDLPQGEKEEDLTAPQSTQLIPSRKTHATQGNSGKPPKRPRARVIDQPVSASFQDPSAEEVSAGANADAALQQSDCCRGSRKGAGLDNCIFHDLLEYLVGMKVSVSNQSEGLSLFVVHQASGYSFNLTLIDKYPMNETELLYRVSSLGTFEMVAPEWMRDVLMFSMGMCPMFFARVSRVIKK